MAAEKHTGPEDIGFPKRDGRFAKLFKNPIIHKARWADKVARTLQQRNQQRYAVRYANNMNDAPLQDTVIPGFMYLAENHKDIFECTVTDEEVYFGLREEFPGRVAAQTAYDTKQRKRKLHKAIRRETKKIDPQLRELEGRFDRLTHDINRLGNPRGTAQRVYDREQRDVTHRIEILNRAVARYTTFATNFVTGDRTTIYKDVGETEYTNVVEDGNTLVHLSDQILTKAETDAATWGNGYAITAQRIMQGVLALCEVPTTLKTSDPVYQCASQFLKFITHKDSVKKAAAALDQTFLMKGAVVPKKIDLTAYSRDMVTTFLDRAYTLTKAARYQQKVEDIRLFLEMQRVAIPHICAQKVTGHYSFVFFLVAISRTRTALQEAMARREELNSEVCRAQLQEAIAREEEVVREIDNLVAERRDVRAQLARKNAERAAIVARVIAEHA